MPKEGFNARTHQHETERQLIAGAIALILLIGLSFAAFRLGGGALFVALGTFGVIGAMIALVWLALKVIEWAAGNEE